MNVYGVRRLLNVSPAEMTDDDLRRALAVMAAEYHDGSAKEAAESVRRFSDAMGRPQRPGHY